MASAVTWNELLAYTWNQVGLGTWDDPLPYPLVRSRNQGAQVTDATTHNINLPAGVQVGDLLYVAFSIDTATTVTSSTSTGWQKLISDKQGTTTNQTGEVWWKRATSSNTFAITSSSAEQSTHISIAIQNAADPVAVSANGASAASFTPPAITPAAGSSNYLTIISGHTDTSAGTTQNFGTSSGYANSTTQQGSTTASAATNTQERTYTGVTTVTPGAVTLSLAEQWVGITTAIRRASSTGAPTVDATVSLTITPSLTVDGTVARPPDVFFDLSNWKITVPYDGPDGDVNADEITQPALATYVDPTYFYLDPSNQMVMNAPVNGDTTSGSTGVRTELREMDGAAESAWDKRTASRQLTVSGYFDPTNITGGSAPKKVMIVGQYHETGGTPGIYLTIDYDASPSRLRLFKDGPGVGNLVTNFTPTDRISFRLECTGGNVNIYGSIGDETTLPSIPQFTFPASGFVEPTGTYAKTGAYNKTDNATGATGNAIAKIVYLNNNQALPTTQQASLSLTATPTLTVSAPALTAKATVSLTASPTLSIDAIRTVLGSLNLTVLPNLLIPGYLTQVASVSLLVTPTLTVNGIRSAPSVASLTATPTLTVAAQITTPATISLTATPTITVNAVRITLSTVTLVATPTISVTAQLALPASLSLIITPTLSVSVGAILASVSLTATPTLSINGIRAAVSTLALTAIPSLSVDATRTTPATISLTISPSLTIPGQLQTFATLSLFAAPTLTVDLLRTTPATVSLIATPTASFNATVTSLTGIALSLTATPTLTINARLTAFASFSGIAIPTIAVDAVRTTPASISLSITPTFTVTAFRVTNASVSLIVVPTFSATVAAPTASVALLISPTISVSVSYIGAVAVQLTASPSLTVDAYLRLPATVSLTITPTFAVGFFAQVPATFALIVTPTLSVDGLRIVPASLALTIIPDFQVNGVRETFPSIDLVISPTISLLALRTAVSSVYLLIIPTLYVKGLIEGAGPGWPIVFRVASVDDGEEPVSSVQTQSKPAFALQSVRNESDNVSAISKPYIDFEEVNA